MLHQGMTKKRGRRGEKKSVEKMGIVPRVNHAQIL